MPRVVQGRTHGASNSLTMSPFKSPIKIPLNDDAQEKARRLQTRHALHDIQMNQIKAAASPVRKLTNFERAGSSSPSSNPNTPLSPGQENNLEGEFIMVGGNPVTPMKRVPLLANFEEWMKMATDNKINATNSWNFALIDYFHDLSLLKEGDGVNFQKASCTLDGCVKIYTSRVDSVATETGKLLSGLADSTYSKKKKGDNQAEEESEEEELDEDGVVRKRSRKPQTQRSSTATLANSFASLQLKKVELEFSVDPLFKKASADFDEGGAKGLLLNHLSIDCKGRIVFDSSDDAADSYSETSAIKIEDPEITDPSTTIESHINDKEENREEEDIDDEDIDIKSLAARFFPNLDILEDQDICHSLKNLDLEDASKDLNIPLLKAADDWRQDKESSNGNSENDHNQDFLGDQPFGSDDDNDGLLGNFDLPGNTDQFGEGGEAWARDAAIDTRIQVKDEGFDPDGIEASDTVDCNIIAAGNYPISNYFERMHADHDDVLNYFDTALQKNWAGPEHWRIRKIKDINRPIPTTKARKDKEPFEIDFQTPFSANLLEIIYTQMSMNGASLPKKERVSKNKNLLPDDKHFNSKRLLRLFLKPNGPSGYCRNSYRVKATHSNQLNKSDIPAGEIDEAFWAQNQALSDGQNEVSKDNYDLNFYQDGGMGMGGDNDADDDIDFADAQEHLSELEEIKKNGLDGAVSSLESINQAPDSDREAFGTQLVTQNRRIRPEYVQYARVAKKIDVRRLKEELWKVMSFQSQKEMSQNTSDETQKLGSVPNESVDEPLKFTSIIQGLHNAYPKQVMEDISTSYCFICLLHLANEKGLIITKHEGLMELDIMRDRNAEVLAEN